MGLPWLNMLLLLLLLLLLQQSTKNHVTLHCRQNKRSHIASKISTLCSFNLGRLLK